MIIKCPQCLRKFESWTGQYIVEHLENEHHIAVKITCLRMCGVPSWDIARHLLTHAELHTLGQHLAMILLDQAAS